MLKKIGAKVKNKISESSRNKKIYLYVVDVVLGLAILAIVVAVIININQKTDDEEIDVNRDTRTVPTSTTTTEDEDKITDEVLKHYAEVNIEGYQEIEGENGTVGAIVINVKNLTDKNIYFAADVVAKDESGNVLDKTSLYAEAMEPEQLYVFNVFSNSELDDEQLKNAHIEVLRAYTYKIDGSGDEASEEDGTVSGDVKINGEQQKEENE